MGYVVVDMNRRTKLRHPNTRTEYYLTEASAKAARTRFMATGHYERLEVMSVDDYLKQVPVVTVRNMMSGKPVQIRADEAGGCTDPSTNRYWEM